MARFILPRVIESAYQTDIFKLMRQITPRPVADIEAWVNDLGELSQRLDILEIASKIAHRMATAVDIQNKKTWREAAHRSNRSQMLYRALQQEMHGGVGVRFRQIIEDNARLITSVPQQVAGSLALQIAKGQQQGMRPSVIAVALRERFSELATGRIHLIARTQVGMASTALTMARSADLNLTIFEWDSSEDSRVRPSHRNMNGVLVDWHDLPAPEALIHIKSTLGKYAPGMCPNCRCIPSVLLSADDVSWPRRVYGAGVIRIMTRAQFQKFTGLPDRIAA
jgi:SPP1 gp7 family putative phage head morphogenesis protein